MTGVNVKDVEPSLTLVGIEYNGDTPMLFFKDSEGELYFRHLQRGILRLDT